MPDFRKGAQAIAEAQARAKAGGGQYSPFAPELYWKGDGDFKYLLFLNPMEEISTVDMISFIPASRKKADGSKMTFFERVIARTDPAIGEDNDPMVDEWQGKPRETCVAVAVELEPTLEKGPNGRLRPTGFEVKTKSYERRLRDDEDKLTDETEEVWMPELGFIHASPHNFFNVVVSADANDFPIDKTACKITRIGSDQNTTYTVTGYEGQEIDLSGLVEYLEGVSYLDEEEMRALVTEIDEINDDYEAASVIGQVLLDKRMEELSDEERYDKLFEGITETLDRFGSKKGSKRGSKTESRRERPARKSSRRSRKNAEDEAPATEDTEPEEADLEAREAEEKPKPRARRSRTTAKEPETKSEEAPKVGGNSKIDRLRKRNEEHKATKAA